MSEILFYPPFPTRPLLLDQVFRTVWHFLPALPKIRRLVFPYAGDDFGLIDAAQILSMAKPYLSRDLDPAIAEYAKRYVGRIEIPADRDGDPQSYSKAAYPDLKGIIVWHMADPRYVEMARQIAAQTGATLVWADPSVVQQETLLTIRFAYELFEERELEALVHECFGIFSGHLKRWKGQPISAFGNGPSLMSLVAKRIEVGPSLRAICNSTIADQAALDHLKPQMLFCGDPVQHSGPSLYAGKFRSDLARAMEEDDSRVLMTQLGYVPYFKEVISPRAHGRIVGIGNDRRPTFNINLAEEFITAATANIFTMLVLPVAFTVSRAVNIYGCDGMSFGAAVKPWSHANEDDYMGKMAVTHRVHPAFWKRNYEEEFWSYCQDLEDILALGEASGIVVKSRTPSFVPGLAKRYSPK